MIVFQSNPLFLHQPYYLIWFHRTICFETTLEVLTHFQQFILTLVKLRLNLRLEDLGHRFNIAKSTVSKYVHILVTGMFQVFVPTLLFWPGEGEVKAKFPMVFVSTLALHLNYWLLWHFCPAIYQIQRALQSVYPTNITTQSNNWILLIHKELYRLFFSAMEVAVATNLLSRICWLRIFSK